MANKVRGFLLDIVNKKAEAIEFEDTLENIYSILGVDCIDVATRRFGDNIHDLIVDDEGLLKEEVFPSVFTSEQKASLVGNVLIVNSKDGEFCSLSDDEIENIKEHHLTVCSTARSLFYPVIVGADYD